MDLRLREKNVEVMLVMAYTEIVLLEENLCIQNISFMEIYNENAYDLLDKRHVEVPIE